MVQMALAAVTPPSWPGPLCSMLSRAGDRRTILNPQTTRAQLLSLGDVEEMRAALCAVLAGPKRATVRDFAEQLAKLSLHYWRPAFTPDQAKHVFGDFAADLAEVTAAELREACDRWRRDADNRFFPTPGQLKALVSESLRERARERAGAERLLAILDERVDAGQPFVPRDYTTLKKNLPKAPAIDASVPSARVETPETLAELRDALQRRIRESVP
jgi:hypothetical protein